MFSQKGKYFSRIFFTTLVSLQVIAWVGMLIGGIFSVLAFWIIFAPLFPFILIDWRVFNPNAYPTFLGWILLILLHSIFSYYIASISSPLFEGFLKKKSGRH